MHYLKYAVPIALVVIVGAVVLSVPALQQFSMMGDAGTTVNDQISVTKTVGEREGSYLIQKINPDSVDGLWDQKYPVSIEPGVPKTLHIGDDIGHNCEGVSEKLTSIDYRGQRVTFTKVVGEEPMGGCPICLSGNTMIDTPHGLMPVKDMKVGQSIWTVDTSGRRVVAVVLETSRVPVPPTHTMVHLILQDGRELYVSPGHPTIDGRTVGDLSPGDIYDGSSIAGTNRVPYDQDATYDVLPSGDTGFYFANGILLDSTLRKK